MSAGVGSTSAQKMVLKKMRIGISGLLVVKARSRAVSKSCRMIRMLFSSSHSSSASTSHQKNADTRGMLTPELFWHQNFLVPGFADTRKMLTPDLSCTNFQRNADARSFLAPD